jgi:rare lipoprotein A
MITRARRAIPGIIVSLLLATPAFAPAAQAAEPAKSTQPRKQARITPAAKPAPAPQDGWRQAGIASWYGGARWHGKKTASGAVYDENLHTAAHATLPIGSRIKVVVADTGRSVVVTINDRPGTRTRIIDLSRGAAQALGIVQRGIARVTLQPA